MKSTRITGAVPRGAALLLCLLAAAAQAAPRQYGRFVLDTDAANAHLPVSLRLLELPGIELLDPAQGLNLSFTDFEFRNKFYREENRNTWEGKPDPRFVTDVPENLADPAPEQDGDFSGEAVSYENSYAAVKRSLLFHDSETRARIVYRLAANRELLIHMPAMFAVILKTGGTLSCADVLDARDPAAPPLTETARSTARALLNTGPTAFRDQDGSLALLVSHTVRGDLPEPMPFRMLRLQPGNAIELAIELECFINDRDGMLARMREHFAEMDASTEPCRLYATGRHVLYEQKQEAEGEALLLRAAEAAPDWYMPYMAIAEYRLQNKVEGVVRGTTTAQNYHEAAFRMPWNYGIILRGGDYLKDERLSESQQRLLLFNLVCAMENTLFYPDYYAWLARPFEERKMHAQACAIYRQALWAVDHWPVAESKREQTREKFRRKIADIEQTLLNALTADPPPPIEVRP